MNAHDEDAELTALVVGALTMLAYAASLAAFCVLAFYVASRA